MTTMFGLSSTDDENDTAIVGDVVLVDGGAQRADHGRAEQLVEGEHVGLHVGVLGGGVLGVVGVVGDRELDRAVAHAAVGVAGVPEELASLGDALGRTRKGPDWSVSTPSVMVSSVTPGPVSRRRRRPRPRAGGGVVVLGRAAAAITVTVAQTAQRRRMDGLDMVPLLQEIDGWPQGPGVAGATSSAMSTASPMST